MRRHWLHLWGGGAIALALAAWGLGWLPLAQRPTPNAAALTDLCANASAAPAWPHLRGPRYDGIAQETGLAEHWPAEGPPLLWTHELGQGFAGFVVVGGRAYTQCQQLSGQYLVCLDVDTGAEFWRQRYDQAWQRLGAYPGPYASPTLAKSHVYFASPSGLVGCVEADTGRPRWSRNLVREFRGRGAGFGYACSPLVEDDLVIFPVGGKGAGMVALHAEDGSTAWQSGDDPASYCPAMPITWRGRRLIVGFLRNTLVVFDLKTGQLLARTVLSTDYDEHSAWPLYQEPNLLIASPFRAGAQLLCLEPQGDSLTLRPAWSSKELSNDVLSSVLIDGHVYGFDLRELQARVHRTSRGVFRCLDFASGKVKWSTEEVGHASALAADGKLILLNDTGTLILARASSTTYEELARHVILPEGPCWTPPTLWRGRLLVRNQQHAVCVYLGNPEDLSPGQRAQAATAARPVSGRWDWTWLIGREPDFPNDAPSWTELAAWHGIGLGIFFLAGVVVLGGCLAFWLGGKPLGPALAHGLFWFLAAVLGLVAPPVLGHGFQQFAWTWPVCLFVAFQVVILTITWVERRDDKPKTRWLSRLVVLLFLGLCYIYYLGCQQLGLATAWTFLVGFLPAWPAAVWAARSHARGVARPWQACWFLLAYSMYYWSGAAFLAVKALRAEDGPWF